MPKGEYQRKERTFMSHYAVQADIEKRFRMLKSGNVNAAATLLVKLQRIVMEPVR